MEKDTEQKPSDFIRERIISDIKEGRVKGEVVTRFPPEPNGYLHIGHAKSICLNFGIAKEFNGRCHLRFDDTNPIKEDVEYIDSIKDNVRWLGFDWGKHEYYASDYFEKIQGYAVELIKTGKAYVDSLTADEIREHRGTLQAPGKESPYRSRTVDENLDLFTRMTNGEYPDGTHVLRAKIDMAAKNLDMRDPVIYRIRHTEHHRTGSKWCIYPMYDFAHCLSDAIEGITHSICTLEFEDNRVLYDWFLNELKTPCHPRQIEFARLNLTFTVMSKRKLLTLVEKGLVSGWDDPRMPTLSGMRRRGYPPLAIRRFCELIGVAKTNSTVSIELLEHCVRENLNLSAKRVMAVINPVKVIIDNYPDDKIEWLEADNNPEDPAAGKRQIPFSKTVYIEKDDFMENPPKKFFRLSPGREIRLKHAYYITCKSLVKNDKGEVTEIHCDYDPDSRGGGTPDGRKVQGTLHWVSAAQAVPVEVRLYSHLFAKPDPEEAGTADFISNINPESLVKPNSCLAEPTLTEAKTGERFQFLRLGYFVVDPDSITGKLVFNRTVTLKDTWAKIDKPKDKK